MPEHSNYLEGLDPVVGALSGDEIIGASKDGDAVSLTAQQISNLSGGGGTWGSITGTLSDQTDLQSAIDAKVGNGINDGVTTIAPSQDAVFDALALKSDILVSFRTLTASHTLDATDLASVNAGDVLKIKMNVATANTVTIPLNATQAFPVGSAIIIQQIGAGQTSIAVTGGVTANSANGWVKIAYQFASVVLTKTATDTWDIEGTLTA